MTDTEPNIIDAILPLRISDFDRSEILRSSLRRFFPDLGTCWVVTPDQDAAEIRSRINDPQFVVTAESEIAPELKDYPRINGWFIQQLLKIAIARYMTTEFYLTLDADVICTRLVKATDLIQQGRAVSMRYKGNIHHNWYDWASRVLRVPASPWRHSVTPLLIHKQAMLALQDFLAYRARPQAVANASQFSRTNKDSTGNWRQYLLRNLPWTEYALYFTFLESMEMYQQFYNTGSLAGNNVWSHDDYVNWQAGKSFAGSGPPFFTVVQSNLGLPVPDVWERVQGYLQEGDAAETAKNEQRL